MFQKQDIKGSDVLDHLGLIAATIDTLGISKEIDKRLPLTKTAKTSYGQRVTAMLLNGLGFMDDRLYLFPKFLENKPVAKLFGSNLKAEDFNDDALGRCLDAIHDYGETKLFSEISLSIALQHNLLGKTVHLDTTTLSLYGAYENEDNKVAASSPNLSEESLSSPSHAYPAYGYAKNKRFDLKQMTLLLATTGAAHFPLWMESHSGNSSDKITLEAAARRMQKFCKTLADAPALLYVGDSAIYASCVKQGDKLLWLSRVPDNIKLAKTLLSTPSIDWITLDQGYKMYPIDQNDNKAQRWVMIYSQQAYDKEIATLEKNIAQEAAETNKVLWHLGNQLFGCVKDMDKQLLSVNKKLKYHKINYTVKPVPIYQKVGRPKKGDKPDKIEYQLETSLLRDESAIEQITWRKGRFILASNQLDKDALKDSDFLSTYKEQTGVEAGFKFIKDDAFEVDSIFLKKPGRISALMMLMTLCLMVYSFSQYFLRKQLVTSSDTILSQSGYATNRPSMKWVYRLFHGVHVLKVDINQLYHEIVLNVNDIMKKIILYFGPVACTIYDIADQNA